MSIDSELADLTASKESTIRCIYFIHTEELKTAKTISGHTHLKIRGLLHVTVKQVYFRINMFA